MILTIDIGNTRIKTAVFQDNIILNDAAFDANDFQKQWQKILNQFPNIQCAVVSTVRNATITDFLHLQNKIEVVFVNTAIKFPFENLYSTPKTLGLDRLVLATGAVLQYPKQNRLIIDAGTCVTYDYVNDNDQYLGGAISPGIRLRYKALHQYTAKLPLLTVTAPDSFIGNSTQMSIHSGVVNGLANEIDGFVNQYIQENENFIIILTGGDANFLAKRLKNAIFANSNFLLESLNQLYQYLKIQND